MITIEQCRAARGLLDWTQQDLSDASGLSKTAINNFEKGHSDIKNESLRAIRMAFESADIEFMEHGLRRRSDTVRIIKGPNAYSDLFDDINDTLKNTGGVALATGIDQTQITQQQAERLHVNGITLKLADSTQMRVIYGTKVATLVGGVMLILNSTEAAKTEKAQFEQTFPLEEINKDSGGQKNRAF